GICARQACGNRNGRKIHRRQFAHRQGGIAEQAENHQGGHQQGGENRPLDENARYVHAPPGLCPPLRPSPPLRPLPTATLVPGTARNWPSVITCSPGCTAPWIASSVPSSLRTVTGLLWTTESLSTTST